MNLAEQAGPQEPLCTPRDEKAFLCGLGAGVGVDEEQLGKGEPGSSSSDFPFSAWNKIKPYHREILLEVKVGGRGLWPCLTLVFLFGFSFWHKYAFNNECDHTCTAPYSSPHFSRRYILFSTGFLWLYSTPLCVSYSV